MSTPVVIAMTAIKPNADNINRFARFVIALMIAHRGNALKPN
jgi:hypothetical protein